MQQFPLKVNWVGYELRPERPVDGELLDKLYPGFDAEKAYQRFNQIGEEYGLSFQPVNFLPNTKLALVATEYAKDQGLFDDYHNAVFRAYFSEGKNIGSQEVLLELAAKVGLDPGKTEKALVDPEYLNRLTENRKLGVPWQIAGLPTFIIADSKKIVGAQPLATYQRALEQIINQA